MSEPTPALRAALARVEQPWSDQRSERVLRAMRTRKKRRAAYRLGISGAVCAAAAGWIFFASNVTSGPTTTLHKTHSAAATVQWNIADGIVGSAVAPGTVLTVTGPESDATMPASVRLISGHVRFAVTARAARPLRVDFQDGDLTLQAGVFSAARYENRVELWVEHGELAVRWHGAVSQLRAGEHAAFPTLGHSLTPRPRGPSQATLAVPSSRGPIAATPGPPTQPVEPFDNARRATAVQPARSVSSSPAPSLDPPARVLTRADTEEPAAPSRTPDWRKLARDGAFDSAFRKMKAAGSKPMDDNVADLMLAADVARLSGHPSQAIGPLELVTRNHAGDPRAALAAFTAGRVYLDDLGRPGPAARAFRLCQTLSPSGAMAQDALAREVQSLATAGRTKQATLRGRHYLRRYPHGRRAKAVRQYADL